MVIREPYTFQNVISVLFSPRRISTHGCITFPRVVEDSGATMF